MGLFNLFKKKEDTKEITYDKTLELNFKQSEKRIPTKEQILKDIEILKKEFSDEKMSDNDIYDALCGYYLTKFDIDLEIEDILNILK